MAAKGFSTSNHISNTVGGFSAGPYTMFCWAYPTTFSANQCALFCGDPADGDPGIYVGFNTSATLRAHAFVSTQNNLAGSTALTVNNWYAIGVSDSNAGTNRKLWLNGAVDGTTATAKVMASCTLVRVGAEGGVSFTDPLLTGAEPKFRAAGTGVAAQGDGAGAFASCSPAFPATTVTEDIAFLQVQATDNTSSQSVDTPAGWTLLALDATAAGTNSQYIFWKQCDGTEGSAGVSVTGTCGAGAAGVKGLYARIYVFSDVALSSFNESGGAGTGTDTTAEISSITSSVNNCLGMFFCCAGNDVTQAAISGNTATWTEVAAEFTSVTGPDGSIGLQTAVLATAGTFSGGSATLGAGPVGWIQRSFSMKPRNSAVQGKLAHCAVWNVELSASDHAELAAGVSPLLVRPSALTFYAPLLDNATLNELVPVNTLTGSLTFESDG